MQKWYNMSSDTRILNSTESICPECLQRIPARNVKRGDSVYLVKECPEHGPFSTVIWRGEPDYEAWGYAGNTRGPGGFVPDRQRGCPFDCGLCPAHRNQPCAVLLEITSRCNLGCPVCFADADKAGAGEDPSLSAISGWYRRLLSSGGPVNIQLSGGEPTMRDDLPDIIALGRQLGFDFIQINTNGLRLGQEPRYAEKLKAAGLSCAFLQFDGTDDRMYESIRGAALLRHKAAAVKHCADNGIGVVLACTLVPGVNTAGIGDLIRYALQWVPHVRAVHFQPMGYIGRYPGAPRDEDRFTIPEIIRALETQSQGLVRVEHFVPPAGENSHCSFHGNFIILPDGSLKPWVSDLPSYHRAKTGPAGNGTLHARNFMARQWSAPQLAPPPLEPPDDAAAPYSVENFLSRLNTHTLSISGMAFQDAWNLDLERLRDCHISVISRDSRIIPFCAYNLTSRSGGTLYRECSPLSQAFQA
ncbi:MAG: radical SAM protein [Deltaproteobacteria bacterium]|nr:radical SAM protein [Deltaproteobacteria bacterium]